MPSFSMVIQRCAHVAIWTTLSVVASAMSGWAEETRNASYFCTPNITSGIKYDSIEKAWVAASFIPTRKFVLKMEFIDEAPAKLIPLKQQRWKVWMTPEGTNYNIPCLRDDQDTPEIITGARYIQCEANLEQLRFSLDTNRFLTAYLVGYVSGKDSNDDTRAISAGLCTKIK